jgi:hypothetical protein
VRQILGWREYVWGVYWTGQIVLACLKQTVGQPLEYGYAHHIQRLMVTGLYALRGNQRMSLQLRNPGRLAGAERRACKGSVQRVLPRRRTSCRGEAPGTARKWTQRLQCDYVREILDVDRLNGCRPAR